MTAPRIPLHRLDIIGLTSQIDDPTGAVQYRVVDEAGAPHLYGDQQWVADGRALDHHPGGHVEYRPVAITYGEWTRPCARYLAKAAADYIAAERATETADDVRAAEEERDMAFDALAAAVDALGPAHD